MFAFQLFFYGLKFVMQLFESFGRQVNYRMILVVGKGKTEKGRKVLEECPVNHQLIANGAIVNMPFVHLTGEQHMHLMVFDRVVYGVNRMCARGSVE